MTRLQLSQVLSISSSSMAILSEVETAIDFTDSNATNHRKANHIDTRYHTVHYYPHEDKISLNHVSNTYQIADICAKVLGPQLHRRFLERI